MHAHDVRRIDKVASVQALRRGRDLRRADAVGGHCIPGIGSQSDAARAQRTVGTRARFPFDANGCDVGFFAAQFCEIGLFSVVGDLLRCIAEFPAHGHDGRAESAPEHANYDQAFGLVNVFRDLFADADDDLSTK